MYSRAWFFLFCVFYKYSDFVLGGVVFIASWMVRLSVILFRRAVVGFFLYSSISSRFKFFLSSRFLVIRLIRIILRRVLVMCFVFCFLRIDYSFLGRYLVRLEFRGFRKVGIF